MKKILITIATLLLASISFAETIQCRVNDINDGDTITCLTHENKQIKVRLWEIDAPKSGQAYSQEAKQALSKMILDKYITVLVKNNDYINDSAVGTIFVWYSDIFSESGVSAGNCLHSKYVSEEEINKKNNTCGPWPMVIVDINHKMLKQGMAWHTPSTEENSEYQQAEQEARETKLGLWAETNPIPPWKWRNLFEQYSGKPPTAEQVEKIKEELLDFL